jgi:uncharacterized protein involved in tolerance to divalent cations
MTDKIVVLSTCASPEEAEKIARALVEKKLAACVNILPAVHLPLERCDRRRSGNAAAD